MTPIGLVPRERLDNKRRSIEDIMSKSSLLIQNRDYDFDKKKRQV